MLPQVLDIDCWQTAHEEFKLLVVKHLNEVQRHKIMESLEQGIDLNFDTLIKSVV